MSRAETFPKPSILCHFLPTDAPLKATQPVDFGAALKPAVREGREGDVAELLAALTQARQMVTWALDKDRSMVGVDELASRVREYASLLRGFRAPPGAAAPPPPPADADAAAPADAAAAPADAAAPPPAYDAAAPAATLRHAVSYAWRDLLDTKGRDWAMADCDLEEASVLLAAAQALLSRAARESINDANAVAVYASLRRAAGFLGACRARVEAFDAAPRPPAPAPKQAEGSSWFSRKKQAPAAPEDAAAAPEADGGERASQDLRLGLAEAWAALALAEAQHATIRRAAAAPHIEWSLVAALCADERQRYADAIAGRVASLTANAASAKSVKEWAGKRVCTAFLRSHVDYKGAYFEALARYCAGAAALEKAVADTDEASCGVACAELAEAARAMAAASASAKDYVANAKAVCYVDSPVVALGDAAATIRRALDRANQLNNGIFHKPVPPPGPLPPAKSLVTAIPFDDPPPSPLWTDRAWAAFDAAELPAPTFGPASEGRDCCVIS